MEDLDLAQERSELEREALLRRIMNRKPDSLEPRGECYNCDHPLPGGKRFCDADCVSDYERRQRRTQR